MHRQLIAVVTALACSGCGGGGTTAPAVPAPSVRSEPATSPGKIVIKNFVFTPSTLAVPRGTTITVTNQDSAAHTLTATDHSFDSGDLKQGQSYSFTVDKAGTFAYICDIHQYMTGSLTVS